MGGDIWASPPHWYFVLARPLGSGGESLYQNDN